MRSVRGESKVQLMEKFIPSHYEMRKKSNSELEKQNTDRASN